MACAAAGNGAQIHKLADKSAAFFESSISAFLILSGTGAPHRNVPHAGARQSAPAGRTPALSARTVGVAVRRRIGKDFIIKHTASEQRAISYSSSAVNENTGLRMVAATAISSDGLSTAFEDRKRKLYLRALQKRRAPGRLKRDACAAELLFKRLRQPFYRAEQHGDIRIAYLFSVRQISLAHKPLYLPRYKARFRGGALFGVRTAGQVAQRHPYGDIGAGAAF